MGHCILLAEKHGTSVLCVVSPIACHTMANENQGTDRESDVFDVLKRYDIVFVDHVQCLLKNLGYKCLRSISSITDIPALESFVRTIIYTEDRFAKMTDEEKLELFGKFFQHNPTNFIFLPGERAVLLSAVQIATKLLKTYETQYNYDKSCSGKKRKGKTILKQNTENIC